MIEVHIVDARTVEDKIFAHYKERKAGKLTVYEFIGKVDWEVHCWLQRQEYEAIQASLKDKDGQV